ncbi:MAG: Hsp33 family molecular chaperone HslO [Oscillospiraceae bacterium]|nr:Hsp33 family molecular chaperone HslO [Oscillospiraceae bacterium]MBQ7053633.1 Hsp33 family molecular chaperone HslO [Oscillospiraceae bacterium]
MSDRIIRAVTCDGAIKILAMTARETVDEARRIHDLTPLTSAALGRTLVAASLLGNDLKGENDTITVRIDSDGPIGSIVAVSDSLGYVRGYCKNPQADLPVRESDRKIDVSGGVGNGTLSIIKDLGMKEPYIGQTQLVSGEIAEDITAYLATSEQIPSVCALGVLVERDWSIRAAGGYIIQLLPGVYDDEIDRLEECIKKARAVTECLDEGMSLEEILETTLTGFEIEVLDEYEVGYKCTCSRERTRGVLMSIGAEELRTIAEEDGQAEVNCQFCDNKYLFNKEELYEIIKEIERK